MAGIYIHIPFCKQACHYCDFHFSTQLDLRNDIIASINKEIEIQKGYLNEPIQTIYFGGGTPSLLKGEEIEQILKSIEKHFNVESNLEITLEANPDDLNKRKLDTLNEVGVNRLSIGVQSFDQDVLKFLNRAHNQEQAENCIKMAKEIGFKNLTIDLIYGIPDRDHELWLKDIRQLVNHRPNHISAYCLTIEPQTAFGNWIQKGKLNPVSQDFAAEQFEILVHELEKAGYEQYEISNFCLSEQYSQHNTAYWQKKPYLGVGPSAHSYNLESRQYNISNNAKYVKALNIGKIPFELEKLSEIDQINDYLLTSLRTKWGVDLNEFKHPYELDSSYIELLQKKGKAIVNDNTLTLTKQGRLIADQITADLLIE